MHLAVPAGAQDLGNAAGVAGGEVFHSASAIPLQEGFYGIHADNRRFSMWHVAGVGKNGPFEGCDMLDEGRETGLACFVELPPIGKGRYREARKAIDGGPASSAPSASKTEEPQSLR
jgi:hypothetical protein